MPAPLYPPLPLCGRSRTEVRAALGLTSKSLSLFCRGLQRPSHETITRLCDYLELDPWVADAVQMAYGYVPASLRILARADPLRCASYLRDLHETHEDLTHLLADFWAYLSSAAPAPVSSLDALPPGKDLSRLPTKISRPGGPPRSATPRSKAV